MIDQPAPRRILIIDDNQGVQDDFRKIAFAVSRHRLPGPPSALAASEAVLFGAPALVATPELELEIASALQGQEGVMMVRRSLSEERPFAVVFVDMRMPPGWDGLETTRRLLAEDPCIQVVICTAYSDVGWPEMAAAVGVSDRVLMLKKPFDAIEVVQLMQSLSCSWELLRETLAQRLRLEQLVGRRTAQLAAASARLASLLEACPLGIFACDAQGRLTLWNTAAQRIFGWSLAEFGPGAGSADGGDGRQQLALLMRAWLADPLSAGCEQRMRLGDGSESDLFFARNVLRSAQGLVDGLVAIVSDISAQKRRADEYRRARQAADATAGQIADFIATVSHEMRTPMNGMIGMTDLLGRTGLDHDQRACLATAHACAERALELINQLIAKSAAGAAGFAPGSRSGLPTPATSA
jgi:two-component system cell cycle sensor histidine kinase/response regulator CckA